MKYNYANLVVQVPDILLTDPTQAKPSEISTLGLFGMVVDAGVEKIFYMDVDTVLASQEEGSPLSLEMERLVSLAAGHGNMGSSYITLEHYFYLVDHLGDEAAKRTLAIRMKPVVTQSEVKPFTFIWFKKENFPNSAVTLTRDLETLCAKLESGRQHFKDWLTSIGMQWTEAEAGVEEL